MAPPIGRKLDALNFFLADVRDGLGPYLAIYLLSEQHWDEASIGVVMSIGGIAGILAQTPAGALVDGSHARLKLLVAAALIVTLGSLTLPWLTSFSAVAVMNALTGAAGSIFAPAIAAVTLGIVGPRAFARRMGRNEAFNHAGNALAAAIAAGTAYMFGPVVVFWLMAALALASIVTALLIPARAIDNDLARGLHGADAGRDERPSDLRSLFAIPGFVVFAACAVLFHLSNAAMLPLVGQKLALANKEVGTSLMAICILGAQAVMVPVAMLSGAKADSWGRKPLFLVGFAILAVRGLLYPLSDSMGWLVAVQLLDGFGAGIYGALFPIIVNDLTYGTGRFNLSQGAIATAQGIGAALSTTVAGVIVVAAGYSAAFLTLGAIALAGLLLYALAMRETRPA
ncbi:MAG: MFS transporter [Hyphomicrobiales bacterium]|nr:MAG: MFS transporter [Hyphomicrobiales bacterium]